MKTYLLLIALLFSSCMCRRKEDADRHVHLSNHLVKITKVQVSKYTYVYGITTYKGKDYKVKSTNGYYYKKYKLKPGDEIYIDIDIYIFIDKKDENNLYDDVATLQFESLDLRRYEKN